MKCHAFSFIVAFTLPSAAIAGGIVAAPPAESTPLWTWFAGGSAGYLPDLDADSYGLQAGLIRHAPSSNNSHLLFLSVGWTGYDRSYAYRPGIPGARSEFADLDVNVLPIGLNYRFRRDLSERFFAEIGGAAGISILDSETSWSWTQVTAPPGLSGSGRNSETDVRLSGELSAALGTRLGASAELLVAARYLLSDQPDIAIPVTGTTAHKAGPHNEFLAEVGFRWHF